MADGNATGRWEAKEMQGEGSEAQGTACIRYGDSFSISVLIALFTVSGERVLIHTGS